MPPKSAFDLKQRWQGMEYVSCEACRKGTGTMDLVAGLFARLYSVKPGTAETNQEIRRFIAGVGNNAPEVSEEINVESDLRGTKREEHKALPDAAAILTTGPIGASYLRAFGARVALALHFELTRQIVPETGGVFVKWMSNNAIVENEVPESFLAMLGPPQSLEQGRQTLEDQFQYKSSAEGDGARSAHFATFRVSFAIQAFVVRDFNELREITDDVPDNVFRPGFLKRP
jgi:hypothetical protein